MVSHIKFCLEEIEAEIEALDAAVLTARDRAFVGLHLSGLRLILDSLSEAHQRPAVIEATHPVLMFSAPAAIEQELKEQGPTELATDNFRLIRGVTAGDLEMLGRAGVTSFATVASWRRGDIEKLGGGKALLHRIAREGWIEQAAMLASGTLTAHAQAIEAGIVPLDVLPAAETTKTLVADPVEDSSIGIEGSLEAVAYYAPTLAKRLEASRRGVPYRQVAATLLFFLMAGAGGAGLVQSPHIFDGSALAVVGDFAVAGGR